MIEKGGFGYISRRKKRILLWCVLILLVAVAIFLTGYFLNHQSRANIFTVLAILCVLPWAKQVVALVVLFPYRSVSRERYDKVSALVQEPVKLYTDLVITSPERIMNLDFAVVGNGQVVALVGKKGQDVAYIRNYLTQGVANWGDYKVKVLESEKLFLQEVRQLSDGEDREENEEEAQRVNSYLYSLIV